MSDVTIPEDIRQTAVQFACCSADGCIRHDDECGEQMVCLEARQIGRAILAERERCAKIAAGMFDLRDGNQARVASHKIAQAIRSSHEGENMVERRAPVQRLAGGIPWDMHLRAYAAYSKRWGPQAAMIDLEGRNCRGGFATDELDEFIPGWREELEQRESVKLVPDTRFPHHMRHLRPDPQPSKGNKE